MFAYKYKKPFPVKKNQKTKKQQTSKQKNPTPKIIWESQWSQECNQHKKMLKCFHKATENGCLP